MVAWVIPPFLNFEKLGYSLFVGFFHTWKKSNNRGLFPVSWIFSKLEKIQNFWFRVSSYQHVLHKAHYSTH
jgi:hypothetical protein